MDSTTCNFGPLVVPAANSAGPLDRASDLNIRTACWGYGRDGPSQGFVIPTFRGDISKITLSGYTTHFLKVTCI